MDGLLACNTAVRAHRTPTGDREEERWVILTFGGPVNDVIDLVYFIHVSDAIRAAVDSAFVLSLLPSNDHPPAAVAMVRPCAGWQDRHYSHQEEFP